MLQERDAGGTALELHAMESHLAPMALAHGAGVGAVREGRAA